MAADGDVFEQDPVTRIYQVLRTVPTGRVTSYGDLAAFAGLPRRARWVGRILSQLPADTRLPWHRVVRADGLVADRPGAARQRERLRAEGVLLQGNRVSMIRYRWRPEEF